MSLLPVEWVDDWPMIGDRSQGELGTMVWEGRLPIQNSKFKIQNEKLEMQRSDEFDATQLGPQWQWNYEPRKEMFSLSERPGWLRLRAFKPLKPGVFLKAGNTLTQRSFRTPHNEVIVKLDISHTAYGLHAGLAHFASQSASLGIVNSSYIILSAVDISSGETGKSRTKAIFGATDEIY